MPLPCLASFDAFWKAPVPEVAEAVMRVGFEPRLAEPVPWVSFHVLIGDLAQPMADVQVGRMRYYTKPPLIYLCQVTYDAVLLLESRYLAVREGSRGGQYNELDIMLLRRGRQVLESGALASVLAS